MNFKKSPYHHIMASFRTPTNIFNIKIDEDENMDIEYCEAVTEYGVETDEIKFKEIPSETVVGVLHKGRYEDFSFAYDFAYRWIEENGYEINGPGRESYIDGIWNKEDKEEWLTEIQIPIKKRLTR